MRISSLGETKLIRRIAQRIRTGPEVLRGIGDDCAVLKGSGRMLRLFASDMLVEGVHFARKTPAEKIGWKAIAVNVSDVAAMGGLPRHAVVSLGLSPPTEILFVDRLYRGLRRCASEYGVDLVGGDTTRASRTVIDVAILGEVEKDRVVYRSGARPGDALLVTGRLGGSLRSGRHLMFRPRVREARAISARFKLHAMMDLSDGLGPDLAKMCDASRVSARVESARVPRRPGCSLGQALSDGEDFELLIAAAPADAAGLLRWAKRSLPCGLTEIGKIVPRGRETAVTWGMSPGMRVPKNLSGFRHF